MDSYGHPNRAGELSEEAALDHLARFATRKIRCLGDKVLRRNAWAMVHRLGWDATDDAEFLALTRLQADAFVTLDADLARRDANGYRV